LLKERLKENAGWQLSCQVILNSLIRMSPVQVSEVCHNKVVDLPLEKLQVVLRRKHRTGQRIPFFGCSGYGRAWREVSVRA